MAIDLRVTHDGLRAHATVRHGEQVCSLDEVIEAAMQPDTDLAAAYRDALGHLAKSLYVVIEKEIDGSSDSGCSWLAIRLTAGINGDTLTNRTHRLTRREFRGWRPTEAEMMAETQSILRRCNEIGLGNAECWLGEARTVREALR